MRRTLGLGGTSKTLDDITVYFTYMYIYQSKMQFFTFFYFLIILFLHLHVGGTHTYIHHT